MRICKSVLVKTQRVNKVFCNMCGNEIEKDIYGKIKDYIHIEKEWGYGSEMDGEEHNIDLCEQCYKKIIEKFKIEVQNKE